MMPHPLAHLAAIESLNFRPSKAQWFYLAIYSIGFGFGLWAGYDLGRNNREVV
jgi:hypothetical protein